MKRLLVVTALLVAQVVYAQTEAAPAAPAPPGAAVEEVSTAALAPAHDEQTLWVSKNVWLEGYAKLGYFWTEASADDALIGSNNGFRLANARIGAGLELSQQLIVFASLDGSVARRNEVDPLRGNRVVDLKDAYIQWAPSRFARLRAGQFKAPFNAETLLPDNALPFVTRSVVTDGVAPPEGFTRAGLTLDRQVGLEVGSERLGGPSGLRYTLALVNGNGPNVLDNDNNSVTPVARVAYERGETFSVGANGYYNQASEGVRPNRLTSNHLGAGGDVTLNVGGLSAFAMVVWRQIDHTNNALPTESGLGLVGSLRYVYHRLEGGVRYAQYEPSSAEPSDRLTELAVMIGYRAKKLPMRLIAQYTLRGEESPVQVNNNSIDGLLQVSW
ncbi:MAG: porin [Myxococcota bacterium]